MEYIRLLYDAIYTNDFVHVNMCMRICMIVVGTSPTLVPVNRTVGRQFIA